MSDAVDPVAEVNAEIAAMDLHADDRTVAPQESVTANVDPRHKTASVEITERVG